LAAAFLDYISGMSLLAMSGDIIDWSAPTASATELRRAITFIRAKAVPVEEEEKEETEIQES
jgi:hypothetical protein